MQDMVIVGFIVEEISNINWNVSNIGQGHQVKVPAKSVQWGEAQCKV